MDNITHSLTGAITARFIESRPTAPEEKAGLRRTFFWLFVISANIPDIDVLLGFMGDPILSIKYHRGLTHSLLFSPVLAILPAGLFRIFTKINNIRLLWIISLLGVVLHIFFDLVTSFGTQVLSPISETRYALDWIFIIDPVFTFGIVLFLVLAKVIPSRRSILSSAGIVFVVLYVTLAAFCYGAAMMRMHESVSEAGISWTRVSTLPQPLSIFKWNGLVQTDKGVLQTYFSLFDDELPPFTEFRHGQDQLVRKVSMDPEVVWFMGFARHPWIRSYPDGESHVVEYRDLMFSIDESVFRSLGFTERSIPFLLQYRFDSKGRLLDVRFDGKEVPD